MSRYRPTELKAYLRSLGAAPTKRLSQNFLIDGNIIRKIVSFADITPGDSVLEIGPGPGALTEALLEAGASVTAVEMDRTFAPALASLQTPDNRLTIIQGDFLKVDLSAALANKHWKVVANLPYHITTPILAKLLPERKSISTLTVMVQKEMADRMLGEVGTKDWSSFSVFLRFYSDPAAGFTVQPSCFYPKPTVKSAVIQLKLHQPPAVSSTEKFFLLVRTAFQQRRKTLAASLKKLYSKEQVESALKKLDKNPKLRPEELSLDDFVRLFIEIDHKAQ